MIAAGANVGRHGKKALKIAQKTGSYDTVKLLLNHGVGVSSVKPFLRTKFFRQRLVPLAVGLAPLHLPAKCIIEIDYWLACINDEEWNAQPPARATPVLELVAKRTKEQGH